MFGLHPNADITYQTNLANETFCTITSIQPKDSGGGAGETREASVQRQANEMLEKLPPDYVPHQVCERAPEPESAALFSVLMVNRKERVHQAGRFTFRAR